MFGVSAHTTLVSVAPSTPLAGLLLLVGLIVGAAGRAPAPTAAPLHPARAAAIADGAAHAVGDAVARYAAGLTDAVVHLGSRPVVSRSAALSG